MPTAITRPNTLLPFLWLFLTLNYIYCDVFSLHYAKDLQQLLTGSVGGMKITEEFLLSFALVMEVPMLMIVLSRYLPNRWNSVLNIIAALFLAGIQLWSLSLGGNSLHYVFFSCVEVTTAAFIIYVVIAARISTQKVAMQAV